MPKHETEEARSKAILNLNDTVLFKLTGAGLLHWAARHRLPGKEGDYYAEQLWVVMSVLGNGLRQSSDQLIEDNALLVSLDQQTPAKLHHNSDYDL